LLSLLSLSLSLLLLLLLLLLPLLLPLLLLTLLLRLRRLAPWRPRPALRSRLGEGLHSVFSIGSLRRAVGRTVGAGPSDEKAIGTIPGTTAMPPPRPRPRGGRSTTLSTASAALSPSSAALAFTHSPCALRTILFLPTA
jgi:hypothetical protein